MRDRDRGEGPGARAPGEGRSPSPPGGEARRAEGDATVPLREDCQQAEELRLAAASGRLAPEDARALAAHLAGCERCKQFAAEIDAVERRLEDALGSIEAPPVDRLLPRERAPLRIGGILALAAAVAVAASAVTWLAIQRSGGAGPATAAVAREATIEVDQEADVRIERGKVVGAAAAVTVGVLGGMVLVRTPSGEAMTVPAGREARIHQGRIELGDLAPDPAAAEILERLAALEKEVEEARLERDEARARVADLEKAIAAKPAAPLASGKVEWNGAEIAPPGPGPAAPSEPSAIARSPEEAAEAEKRRQIAEVVSKLDWDKAVGAYARWKLLAKDGKGDEVGPEVWMELSRMNVAVADISKLLGAESPYAGYGDPEVLQAFVPAWYNALGVGLDPQQTRLLRMEIASEARAKAERPPAPTASFLDGIRAELEESIRTERGLYSLLRQDQYERYLRAVGDDPFFEHDWPIAPLSGTSAEEVAVKVAQTYMVALKLDGSLGDAVGRTCGRYVLGALAVPPVDDRLQGHDRRIAILHRTIKLVDLQKQCDLDLARELPVDEGVRARIAGGGAMVIFRLSLAH